MPSIPPNSKLGKILAQLQPGYRSVFDAFIVIERLLQFLLKKHLPQTIHAVNSLAAHQAYPVQLYYAIHAAVHPAILAVKHALPEAADDAGHGGTPGRPGVLSLNDNSLLDAAPSVAASSPEAHMELTLNPEGWSKMQCMKRAVALASGLLHLQAQHMPAQITGTAAPGRDEVVAWILQHSGREGIHPAPAPASTTASAPAAAAAPSTAGNKRVRVSEALPPALAALLAGQALPDKLQFDNVPQWLGTHAPVYVDQLAHRSIRSARPAVWGDMPPGTPHAVAQAFHARGIQRLYQHQTEAIQAVAAGHNVVMATPTSSGKSAVFVHPTLHLLLEDEHALVLWMFPTKALAQDQLHSLREFTAGHPTVQARVRPATLDGDVEHDEKMRVRQTCNVVLTNPDTVHACVLPGAAASPEWRAWIHRIRLIVLDECHVYRGTFGSHAALTLRRLLRMAALGGKVPQLIGATATIGNPAQHFQSLIPSSALASLERRAATARGLDQAEPAQPRPLRVITESTAPAGKLQLIVWNPPLLQDLTVERAAYWHALFLDEPELESNLLRRSTAAAAPSSSSSSVAAAAAAAPTAQAATRSGSEHTHAALKLALPAARRPLAARLQRLREVAQVEPAAVAAPLWAQQSGERASEVVQFAGGDAAGGLSMAPAEAWVKAWDMRRQITVPARKSAIVEGSQVVAALVAGGFKTLAFTSTRKVAELCLQYVHDRLAMLAPDAIAQVKCYRGGYMKAHRRAIEQDLFAGRLLGVVATCALELGIDVGALDAVVLIGFPGSVASLQQQIGRAGRGARDATVILVPFDSPIDQHCARDPELLRTAQAETAVVDTDNPNILRQHVLCAAVEAPLCPDDVALFGRGLGHIMQRLRERDLLVKADEQWQRALVGTSAASSGVAPPGNAPAEALAAAQRMVLDAAAAQRGYLQLTQATERSVVHAEHALAQHGPPSTGIRSPSASDAAVSGRGIAQVQLRAWAAVGWLPHPARSVSLRAIDDVTYSVRTTAGVEIDRVEAERAYFEVYPGAVYMNQGNMYRVTHLDLTGHTALVKPCSEAFYTSPIDLLDVHVLARQSSNGRSHWGRVSLVRSIAGYSKIWRRTGGLCERCELTVPPMEYASFAVWYDVPLGAKKLLDALGLDYLGGIHAACHAIKSVMPCFVLADSRDIMVECPSMAQARAKPMRLLIVDARPGGIGIAPAAFHRWREILHGALNLLQSCHCVMGCPGCTMTTSCREFNMVMDKAGAILLLTEALTGQVNLRQAVQLASAQAQAEQAAYARLHITGRDVTAAAQPSPAATSSSPRS